MVATSDMSVKEYDKIKKYKIKFSTTVISVIIGALGTPKEGTDNDINKISASLCL